MKKAIIICSVIAVIISCNSGDTSEKNTNTEAAKEAATTAPSDDPEVTEGLDLVAKSDCFTCHKLTEKAIGPSYADVAAKYTGNQTAIDSLPAKIIKGGAGIWGTVPMTPHPTVSAEDAKAMVTYVMSIKK